MFRYSIVLLCAVLVLSNVDFIQAGKYGGGGSRQHSYPRSGGLSGGSHSSSHSYPSSSGHSSGSHSYPSSGGLSGNNRGGGYPAGGGSHSYPNSGGHGYPASGGNSGSHSYPNSGSGLSGSNTHGYPGGRGTPSGGTTNVHHHYHYSPPQQIQYASPHGGPPVNYPVYRGAPPTYVYQYKNSGSKYGTLLAGLALLNLGALAGGAVGYGIGHSSSSSSHGSYKAQPGEVCIFGIKKDNGDFEETKIDCQLISTFILQEQAKQQNSQNQTVTTVTTTNTTIVNTTNAQDTPTYIRLENGTLIPAESVASNSTNSTSDGTPAAGATVMTSSSVTVTNTTVVNAVDVKGKPIEVTPGMQCYVRRKTPSSQMKREIPCGLLQTYADKSLKPNSATRNLSAFSTLAVLCVVFAVY